MEHTRPAGPCIVVPLPRTTPGGCAHSSARIEAESIDDPRPAATTPRHIVVVHILFWGLPHEPGAFKGNTTKVWNPHRDARCCRREELRAREFGREGDCERGSVLVSGSGCIDMRLVPWWPWRMATRLVLDAAS